MSDLARAIVESNQFSEDTYKELNKLSPEVLQEIALSCQQTQPVMNESADNGVDALRADLKTCREDILNLISEEAEIIKGLADFGQHEDSILGKLVPVNNSANSSVDEEAVKQFVRQSNTLFAEILREGLQAREQGRRQYMTVILNSTNKFTESDLANKSTQELGLWADILKEKTALEQKSVYNQRPLFDYTGSCLADNSCGRGNDAVGQPLVLPSTFPSTKY